MLTQDPCFCGVFHMAVADRPINFQVTQITLLCDIVTLSP